MPSGNKRPRTLNTFTTKRLTEHEINWEERGKQGPSRKGKLKARDFEGLEQMVLKAVQTEFQVRVCTMNTFPSDSESELWAIECWKNGCEQKGQEFALTDVHKKLIMERHSTIRGRVKDKVALKAAVYYGFRHGTDDMTIQANKKLAEILLQEDGYVYQDVAQSTGIYAHPILQEIINEQWFDSKNADGIKYSASFHPIPDASIALVFTAVEFVICRWASGRHVKGGAFAEALFHDVYIRHLKGLEAWQTFSAKSAKSLARLKENLHDNGRLHARLPILQDDPKPNLNMMKFSLATQAIESSDED
ncbi:hypothetical protein JB92DRAFT_2931095 [Gautieria morchelliformis]|nr:hypothetical protein JB92DRAFT_2931095 [Gautieria morchelliformis]